MRHEQPATPRALAKTRDAIIAEEARRCVDNIAARLGEGRLSFNEKFVKVASALGYSPAEELAEMLVEEIDGVFERSPSLKEGAAQ